MLICQPIAGLCLWAPYDWLRISNKIEKKNTRWQTLVTMALCLVLISQASPVPGRIPKVYNALITSNQNLEPSKSYPVYQPVIHDPFAYQYQPVFYPSPDFTNLQPRTSGQPQPQPPQFSPQSPQYPQPGPQYPQQGPQYPQQGPQFPQQGPQFPQQLPQFPQFSHQGPQFPQQGPQLTQQEPQIPQQQPIPSDPQSSSPRSPPGPSSETVPEITPPSPDQLIPQPRPGPKDEEAAAASTPSPPFPPNTESPIPLNQFGLPPQVLPLGRINPAYQGFNQVSPFTYSYPNYRFYDPYDPFSLNPYNYPALYRPLSNGIGPSIPVGAPKEVQPSASVPTPAPKNSNNDQEQPQPPSEPENLNVLNYSAKDPAIPNVPPPPLPEGGLKTNEPEQE